MESLLLLVPLLACPLGMALVGGAAWAWARVRRGQPGGGSSAPATGAGES